MVEHVDFPVAMEPVRPMRSMSAESSRCEVGGARYDEESCRLWLEPSCLSLGEFGEGVNRCKAPVARACSR